MTGNDSSHGYASLARSTEALRQWAQARINRGPDTWRRGEASRPAEQHDLDQLQAYKVELALQSEELRRVRADLDVYRARYRASGAEEVEDALRLHSDILNSLGHGVYLIRVGNGEIVFTNPRFDRMFGYGTGELLGKHVSTVNAPGQKSPESVAKLIMAELARTGAWEGEVKNIRKDGSVFWSHANVTTFDHPRYGPVWVSMHDDITERKRVEDQLFHMASTLEQQVNARTSRLREVSAQLAMTEERERRLLAEELHDNLSQLLAVIKIKLTSITADAFESSIGNIVALVDQADQSARLITRELSPQVLHTLGFIPALVSLAKEKRRALGITMHIDCDREPALLEDGMRAMLYRSVRELLTNVGKHARVSEAYFFCRIEESRLRIIVRDHGCGFDPLKYRDASPGSHGFGLTSIYERVINIGGEMTIDSSPGHGTTITLSVPYALATKKGQPS